MFSFTSPFTVAIKENSKFAVCFRDSNICQDAS